MTPIDDSILEVTKRAKPSPECCIPIAASTPKATTAVHLTPHFIGSCTCTVIGIYVAILGYCGESTMLRCYSNRSYWNRKVLGRGEFDHDRACLSFSSRFPSTITAAKGKCEVQHTIGSGVTYGRLCTASTSSHQSAAPPPDSRNTVNAPFPVPTTLAIPNVPYSRATVWKRETDTGTKNVIF